MGLAQKVVEMICRGKHPSQVCQELRLPPSHVARVLTSKRFPKLVALYRQFFDAVQELGTACRADAAQRRLAELVENAQNPETVRKAACRLMDECAGARHGRRAPSLRRDSEGRQAARHPQPRGDTAQSPQGPGLANGDNSAQETTYLHNNAHI